MNMGLDSINIGLAQSAEFYILIGAIALIADVLVPDAGKVWKILPHPATLIGKIIHLFDTLLNRGSNRLKLVLGTINTLIIVGGFGLLGYGLDHAISTYEYAPYLHAFIAIILLAGGALKLAVKKIMIAIDKGQLENARNHTAHLCARDTYDIDTHACGRTGLESLAENLSDGVIAPALYYMVFGLSGIFAYKAINTLDSMIGYKSEKYFYFGKFSARLDDVVNFIPARLSGLLLCLSVMFVRTGNINNALSTFKKFSHTHNSPNAGVPESILAGALDIKLGGMRTYADIGTITHWIGDGDANITPTHMQQALKIYTGSIIIAGLLSVIIVMILGNI